MTAWSYWLFRMPSRILPPQRRRAVPWDGVQVFFVALTLVLFCPWLVRGLMDATSLLTHLYGQDFTAALQRNEKSAQARAMVWVAVLAFPLQAATVFALVRFSGG